MIEDDLVLGALVKFAWVGDRAALADIKPRHIGRVVSFGYLDPRLVGLEGKEPEDVMGILEGREGATVIVTGKTYNWYGVTDFKIYRKVIDSG